MTSTELKREVKRFAWIRAILLWGLFIYTISLQLRWWQTAILVALSLFASGAASMETRYEALANGVQARESVTEFDR